MSRSDDHRFDQGMDAVNQPGVLIPAIEGDVSVTMVKDHFPKAKALVLPQTNTVSDMFLSVMTKKADVIFVDQGMFDSLNASNPGALRKLDNVPPPFVFATYYGYRNGEFALRDMVDIALNNLIDDGTIATIISRYSKDYISAGKKYKQNP